MIGIAGATIKTMDEVTAHEESTAPVVAPQHVIFDLEHLKPLLSHWPAVLPTAENPVVRPLKIGIAEDLLALGVGLSKTVLGRHLRYYAQSGAYRIALTAKGAMRHNLDGRPVAPVRPEDIAFLTGRRRRGASGKKPAPQPKDAVTVRTTAKALKVSLVLDATDFVGVNVPDGQPRTMIEVQVDKRTVTADVASKSVRKAIATARAGGTANTTFVLSGTLGDTDVLLNAGLAATTKPAG